MNTDAPGDKGQKALHGEEAVAKREHAVREREEQLGAREQTQSHAEERSGNLREANEHLVMATLQAQELKDAALLAKQRQDEFLAMLAHELRNPLAPIRSAVALLDHLDAVHPTLSVIRKVVGRQVEHMARLLDDLLDASRVTSGKVTLQRRPTRVDDFVEQAVETNRGIIDTQRHRLTLDMPPDALYVDGDPTRLAQIVSNLLHNAAKYTPEGGAIRVSTRPVENKVEIRVADNGSGISAGTLPTVFDLFRQEDRLLNRSQGGLGIGLTIVRSMVELHGGTVQAHSAGLGEGSEFVVTLPRIEEPVVDPVVELRPVPAAVPIRILLVDDNADAALLLAMLLRISGHEVEVAADGPAALEMFEQQRPQVMLCDIGLPGMNGYQVASRIRERNDTPKPVLIALTGYDAPSDRVQSVAAGFNHHVAKPVDFYQLLRLIDSTQGEEHGL
ncbi:hybrid sensor histidine kinase/response regulator [Variovorax boronicumulans]|uniref:hybrid sensor histidine kinase/response regulator n=1 Tax=Variovorax boronicumulans TaxID=436515 RepID=UPI00339B08FB